MKLADLKRRMIGRKIVAVNRTRYYDDERGCWVNEDELVLDNGRTICAFAQETADAPVCEFIARDLPRRENA